ncbi:RNA-binding (RRM/RBD/RNP motifs) family protein [Striga asiatica]|uniref:RNA-binding (RRM/RBD/RNP motifs) family protein n=1 Tax=Striga asiatica TaxID=4170 RepID=A0A5A7QF89_STRAF|nr:RNA-binding (RRM/RBD/RNP motifs) family protein [Striga asiatica]
MSVHCPSFGSLKRISKSFLRPSRNKYPLRRRKTLTPYLVLGKKIRQTRGRHVPLPRQLVRLDRLAVAARPAVIVEIRPIPKLLLQNRLCFYEFAPAFVRKRLVTQLEAHRGSCLEGC